MSKALDAASRPELPSSGCLAAVLFCLFLLSLWLTGTLLVGLAIDNTYFPNHPTETLQAQIKSAAALSIALLFGMLALPILQWRRKNRVRFPVLIVLFALWLGATAWFFANRKPEAPGLMRQFDGHDYLVPWSLDAAGPGSPSGLSRDRYRKSMTLPYCAEPFSATRAGIAGSRCYRRSAHFTVSLADAHGRHLREAGAVLDLLRADTQPSQAPHPAIDYDPELKPGDRSGKDGSSSSSSSTSGGAGSLKGYESRFVSLKQNGGMIGFEQFSDRHDNDLGHVRYYFELPTKQGAPMTHWAVCDFPHFPNSRSGLCEHSEVRGRHLLTYAVALTDQQNWRARRDSLIGLLHSLRVDRVKTSPQP